MKVNNANAVAQTTFSPAGKAGERVASRDLAQSSQVRSNPAVSIELGATVASSVQGSDLAGTDALKKLAELIERGEYKMDFPKIAENILRDAVAASAKFNK